MHKPRSDEIQLLSHTLTDMLTKTNRIDLVIFGMQIMTPGPNLAAIHRVLISAMSIPDRARMH
jgi:hypothetical protein